MGDMRFVENMVVKRSERLSGICQTQKMKSKYDTFEERKKYQTFSAENALLITS
jgi:hypothetical protein